MCKHMIRWIMILMMTAMLWPDTAMASTVGDNAERPVLVYFSVEACATCDELERELEAMQIQIEQTGKLMPRMEVHNIAQGPEYALMMTYFDLYDVPEQQRDTPVMFLGDQYYIGSENILNGLKIELSRDQLPPTKVPGAQPSATAEDVFSSMTALNVLLVGLVNGFNPCSLSMLLFLFSLLLVKNIRILYIGFAFGAGKLLMYLGLGTLLYGVLSMVDALAYQMVIKAVMALFILIIATMNIRDFFMSRAERYDQVKNQLPAGLRKRNHAIISKLTGVENKWLLLLVAGALGMVIAVGEFLCTGQMYLATITLVLRENAGLSIQAFLYLIIYAVAFVIPLIVITVLIDRGRALFDVSETLRKHMPAIKLVTALLLLVMGAVYIIWL